MTSHAVICARSMGHRVRPNDLISQRSCTWPCANARSWPPQVSMSCCSRRGCLLYLKYKWCRVALIDSV
eukprot:1879973-Pyramimonas_sp.AAC.1